MFAGSRMEAEREGDHWVLVGSGRSVEAVAVGLAAVVDASSSLRLAISRLDGREVEGAAAVVAAEPVEPAEAGVAV